MATTTTERDTDTEDFPHRCHHTYRYQVSIVRHRLPDEKLQRGHYEYAHNGSNHCTYAQLQIQQIDDDGNLQM